LEFLLSTGCLANENPLGTYKLATNRPNRSGLIIYFSKRVKDFGVKVGLLAIFINWAAIIF